MKTENRPYIKAVDALRVIAIVGVILIHTTTKPLEASHYDLVHFQLSLLLNQLSRYAVPLFIIVSGFVLELNYDFHSSYTSFFKKRVTRIAVPYVFWSLIYYFFVFNNNHDNLIEVLATGNASYQLYFIPTLCIFYLIFPLLHKIRKIILNLPVLAGLGALEIFLMDKDYFVRQFNFSDPIRISILSFFFFIVGMYLARNKDKILQFIGRSKHVLVLSVPILAYYIFNEGFSRYLKIYNIEAFYSSWRPDILIYTLVSASLLFYLFDQKSYQYKLTEVLSKLSYLVFFIHVFILEEIWKYIGVNYYTIPGFDFILFGLVVGLSFGGAYLIHKIPHLRKITG